MEIVNTASTMANAARALWNRVGKKSPAPSTAPGAVASELSPQERALSALESRVSAIESEATEHQEQMRASSALIGQLVEQNAQLIKKIQANSVRVAWLSGVAALALVLAASSLAAALVR
jgi:hypothetical protein